jgi:hypothetical protein
MLLCKCVMCFTDVVDEILETGRLQRLESLKANPRKRAIKELCEVSVSLAMYTAAVLAAVYDCHQACTHWSCAVLCSLRQVTVYLCSMNATCSHLRCAVQFNVQTV